MNSQTKKSDKLTFSGEPYKFRKIKNRGKLIHTIVDYTPEFMDWLETLHPMVAPLISRYLVEYLEQKGDQYFIDLGCVSRTCERWGNFKDDHNLFTHFLKCHLQRFNFLFGSITNFVECCEFLDWLLTKTITEKQHES